MNINYKQSQFELFPGAPGSSADASRPRYLFAHLTLSLENTVVLAIMMVMTVVFAFSLGVEKGKKLTKKIESISPINLVRQERSSPEESNKKFDASFPESKIVVGAPASERPLNSLYTIQVASFKEETYAQKEASALKRKGFDAFVAEKGDYSIVCVGKFRDKDQTNLWVPKLKRKYTDCLVRRL